MLELIFKPSCKPALRVKQLPKWKLHKICHYFAKSYIIYVVFDNKKGVNMYLEKLYKLKEYIAYPSFFADKLLNLKEIVEHVVTVE